MVRKTIRGRGSLGKLPELTEKLGMHQPMIIAMEPLTSYLMKKVPSMREMTVFSEFHPNPDLKDCEQGVTLFRENHCDGLISIGGGSSMDTAKGIKAMLLADSTEDVIAGNLTGEDVYPVIAIPGTAGTGAEATQIAVVYRDGKKLSLNHPGLLAAGVILDSELTDGLPEYHKKSCALDALAQGIESYWSRGSTEDSKVHAYLAIRGVLDNLKAYLAGDPHAADEMLDAAFQSGQAIQITRTTAAHAMSYQLTKKLGYAHGHACMLTLPVLWEEMLENEDMKPVLNGLAEVMRLGDPLMGPKLLWGILYELEMDAREMPDETTLDELAGSVNAERLSNHPMTLEQRQLKNIYRRAFTKKPEMERQACEDIWEYYGK